jgi:hypothetical protein
MAKKSYYLSGVSSPSEKPSICQEILVITARSNGLPWTVVTPSRRNSVALARKNQSKHIVDIGADICIKNDMAHFETVSPGR